MELLRIILKNNCDTPRPWGLYFQCSATLQIEGLVELHNNIKMGTNRTLNYLVITYIINSIKVVISDIVLLGPTIVFTKKTMTEEECEIIKKESLKSKEREKIRRNNMTEEELRELKDKTSKRSAKNQKRKRNNMTEEEHREFNDNRNKKRNDENRKKRMQDASEAKAVLEAEENKNPKKPEDSYNPDDPDKPNEPDNPNEGDVSDADCEWEVDPEWEGDQSSSKFEGDLSTIFDNINLEDALEIIKNIISFFF